MRVHQGFTLIELAVVIAVIAILAAVALPRLTDLGDEAERAAVQDFQKKLQTAYGIYTAERSTQPTTFDQFVSQAPLAVNDTKTVSVTTVGRGGCQVQGIQIRCQADDFPMLNRTHNILVTYTLQDRTITVNLPQ